MRLQFFVGERIPDFLNKTDFRFLVLLVGLLEGHLFWWMRDALTPMPPPPVELATQRWYCLYRGCSNKPQVRFWYGFTHSPETVINCVCVEKEDAT